MRSVRFVLSLLVIFAVGATAASAQQVWTGLTKSFTKPTGADYELPEFQDHITPNVALTRGDTAGMINFVVEGFYGSSSPLGTRWATALVPGNEAEAISAANYANLSFGTWANAYGAMNQLSTNILAYDAVVHLIADDIYLDLRFTDWVTRTGGFSYIRAEGIPEPASLSLVVLGLLAAGIRRPRR